jgi:CheY-like chemotaxis protein
MTPSKQILIVEDEKDILELCSLHLKREGFTVTTAEDGEKSLKLLEKNSYDLTILDWMLPGLPLPDMPGDLLPIGDDRQLTNYHTDQHPAIGRATTWRICRPLRTHAEKRAGRTAACPQETPG